MFILVANFWLVKSDESLFLLRFAAFIVVLVSVMGL